MTVVVLNLIRDLDPNHDDKINQEEFILIMKYIEQKNSNPEAETTQLPSVPGSSSRLEAGE